MSVCVGCGNEFKVDFAHTVRMQGVLYAVCPYCDDAFRIFPRDMEDETHGRIEFNYDGEIVLLEKKDGDQGCYFKDFVAFRARPDAPCYSGEFMSGREYWTYNDFLAIAEGDEEIAEDLFLAVDWQDPDTLFYEYLRDGEYVRCETCGKLIHAKCEDVDVCPHCNCSPKVAERKAA